MGSEATRVVSTTIDKTTIVSPTDYYLYLDADLSRLPIPVTSSWQIIGRSKQADIVLSDPYISHFHARIRATPAGLELEDLDSHNGTPGSSPESSDIFLLGQTKFRCDRPGGKKSSRATALMVLISIVTTAGILLEFDSGHKPMVSTPIPLVQVNTAPSPIRLRLPVPDPITPRSLAPAATPAPTSPPKQIPPTRQADEPVNAFAPIKEALREGKTDLAASLARTCSTCKLALGQAFSTLQGPTPTPAALLPVARAWQTISTSLDLSPEDAHFVTTDLRNRLRGVIDTLVTRHDLIAATRILNQFSTAGLRLDTTDPIYKKLQQPATALYQQAYAVERINQSRARTLYQQANAITPVYFDLHVQISARLNKLN